MSRECVQDVVTKARAALLDSRLTGEATLPANPGSNPHPATHSGGFYMGEVSMPMCFLSAFLYLFLWTTELKAVQFLSAEGLNKA